MENHKIKHCNKCSKDKPICEFSKDSHKKDGLRTVCGECTREQQSRYRKNPEVIEKLKLHRSTVEYKNRQKFLNQTEKYKEAQRVRDQRDFVKKRKALNLKTKKSLEQIQKRKKERYYSDPIYRLKAIIRASTLNSFKSIKVNKLCKTSKIIGCSYEKLKQHIENQFTEGMSWDLFGKIHIDHIKPLSTAKTEKDLIKLAHYTNLQPLWAEDNIKKSNKYDE